MTLGQFLTWVAFFTTWRYAGRWCLGTPMLIFTLVLRFISRLAANSGSWFERYATLAFSPDGSLLLWEILTAITLTVALVSTGMHHGTHKNRERRVLIFIALLMLAESYSLGPRPVVELDTITGILLIIHTLSIFSSYACQLVLLGWSLPAHDTQEPAHLEPIAGRLVTAALVFQLLGTLHGSLWAVKAWGTPWSWDPIECLSLAALIWLAAIFIFHNHMTGWRRQLCLVAIPIYTIIGTLLVRSGLLAKASYHGYLSGALGPLALISLIALSSLAWVTRWVVGKDSDLPRELQVILIWGAVHWLAGLAIARLPASKPSLAQFLSGSWLVGCAWLAIRLTMVKPFGLRANRKP